MVLDAPSLGPTNSSSEHHTDEMLTLNMPNMQAAGRTQPAPTCGRFACKTDDHDTDVQPWYRVQRLAVAHEAVAASYCTRS